MTLKKTVVIESKDWRRTCSISVNSRYWKIIGHFFFKMFRKGNFLLSCGSPQFWLSCRPEGVRQGWEPSLPGCSSLRHPAPNSTPPACSLFPSPHWRPPPLPHDHHYHIHTTLVTKYSLRHLHKVAHIWPSSLWVPLPFSPLSSLDCFIAVGSWSLSLPPVFLPSTSFLHTTTKEVIQKYKYFHALCKFQWFRV